MKRKYSQLNPKTISHNLGKIIAPTGMLFLMAAASLTHEPRALPQKMSPHNFRSGNLGSKTISSYKVIISSDNVQLRTGDSVRDAVMQQAISLLAVRDNATKDSALNRFLSHDLAEQDHVKMEPGNALPPFGNDICGLLVSAVYETVQHSAGIKVFPYAYEGRQALRAYIKLNPKAVHDFRAHDSYEPKPGDIIITNHAGGGSHAVILLGITRDALGTNFYTLDMGRVNPKEDKEHNAELSNFRVDKQEGKLARILKDGSHAPRGSSDTSNAPDAIYVIEVDRLPNYNDLRKYWDKNPAPPVPFPSFGGPHPKEAANMRQELILLLPELSWWKDAAYVRVRDSRKTPSFSQPHL